MPQRMVLTRSVAPATEPLSLTEAKAHLRVDFTDDDTYITALIAAARTHIEEVLGRSLITQTWQLRLDDFHEPILLPRPPLISVTSVTYLDGEGASQTLAASRYAVQQYDLPPRITKAYGETWPITRDTENAVTVEYTAGYGAAADVPDSIKHAMRLLIGDMYENREEKVLGTVVARLQSVDALLAPFKVWWF